MALESTEAPARPNHNLPSQLTTFVGRDVELGELRRLLHERRLVTLTGAGGSGKTRLALESALTLTQDFPDGVFLADLAPLSSPELVPETVGRVFGVEVAAGRSLMDALALYLRERAVLLVLDNCEHLLDACAGLASALLAACPALRVLATSREPLEVAGESTFRVPLLSFPDPLAPTEPDELMQFEAIQLFLDRARLADPAFALSAGNAPAVAQVCARLDGIPLALELAAAALRGMPIDDLAARLDQRFRLLTTGERTALPRHQTLRALLDWSYTHLDEREQAVFRQIAVFPADWTLDAAEFVCTAGSSRPEVLDRLLRLVNKSLVQLNQPAGRYRMLETVRLYALQKLAEASEQENAARSHFAWYLGLVEGGVSQTGGAGQQQWFLRLEREQANLRAALGWAVEGRHAGEAARLALALFSFWSARAYQREADCWLAQILALPGSASLPPPQRARLLGAHGILAHTLNQFEEAKRYHGEALQIWREQGDLIGIATALKDLGWQCFQEMDLVGARRYAEESLALAREAGDATAVGMALQILTAASAEAGWFDGLVPALEECLAIWRGLGVLPEQAAALGMLARVEQRLGNLERAASLMLEALRLQAGLGDYSGLITYLVLMMCFEFDVDTGPHPPGEIGSYQPLAYLQHGRLLHGPGEATRILAAVAAWEDRVIGGNTIQWDTMVVPLCAKLRADMGEDAFEREFAAGRTMSVDDIVAFAEEYARSVLTLLHPLARGTAKVRAPQSRAMATAGAGPTSAMAPGKAVYPAELTPREMQVLRLVADGLTNRQAAERLVVTPRTINAHLTSIYSKTGVTSRAAAVRFAFEHGLV